MTTRAGQVFALVVTLFFTLQFAESSLKHCQKAPEWSVNGIKPFEMLRGKATVVVYTKASSHHFAQFARSIHKHLETLKSLGMIETSLFVVAEHETRHKEKVLAFQRHSQFTVFIDNSTNPIRKLLGGKHHGDVSVFDRCGRLTYYVPYPLGMNMYKDSVEPAIIATYTTNICPNPCNKEATTTEKVIETTMASVETSKLRRPLETPAKETFEGEREKEVEAPKVNPSLETQEGSVLTGKLWSILQSIWNYIGPTTEPTTQTPPLSPAGKNCLSQGKDHCSFWSQKLMEEGKRCCRRDRHGRRLWNYHLKNCEGFTNSRCHKFSIAQKCCQEESP